MYQCGSVRGLYENENDEIQDDIYSTTSCRQVRYKREEGFQNREKAFGRCNSIALHHVVMVEISNLHVMGRMGRKSKYADTASKILELIAQGATYREACLETGISEMTFYKWMSDRKEFSELIKKAEAEKLENMVSGLEKSILKKANGYKITEKRAEYVEVNGSVRCVKKIITEKDVAPDIGALIFLLTNLAPEKWQNKQKQELLGEVSSGLNIIVENKEGLG